MGIFPSDSHFSNEFTEVMKIYYCSATTLELALCQLQASTFRLYHYPSLYYIAKLSFSDLSQLNF